MGKELREGLEHLFNFTGGGTHGEGTKVFSSTDIRLGASGPDDFTLRASSLKEALAKIEKGNFAVCPLEAPFVPSGEDPGKKDPKLLTASGCPPTFPNATLGLVKAEQWGGTGGEDDWTTFHAKTPWKIAFEHENQSVTWNLVKKAQHSSMSNVRDGLNDARPCLGGTVHCGTDKNSPEQCVPTGGSWKITCGTDKNSTEQHLMRDPLKEGMKEKDRIRKATKDRKTYLLGDPHWKRKKEEENPKQDDDSGVETESSQEVSPTPRKVFIFTGHHLRLHLSTALYVLFLNTNQFCLFHSARTQLNASGQIHWRNKQTAQLLFGVVPWFDILTSVRPLVFITPRRRIKGRPLRPPCLVQLARRSGRAVSKYSWRRGGRQSSLASPRPLTPLLRLMAYHDPSCHLFCETIFFVAAN